ncbi:polyketide cyclase / dehydrase and lipid transport [Actinophytocola gossypii]|uniref:Polyketide cyclase / dehydrase and lipid transport n=1 Tax=Actinophytocola gossypii TaxID=2812003 RepID=A0ABT2J8A3_9PSEU|nr:polyketide cyclase / dehydrase and lipid transport [Actinophytocola gossypii]MCT2584090.1 polyketide cyclase / dehydrase and lipid transport [Actinophytocola gossypii]
MPEVDVIDETFLAVPPATVARAFTDPGAWRRFWPDLRLEVYADRGDEGLRWTVGGALVGTMEVWLEPVLDGTVLHYFLRADLPAGTATRRGRLTREKTRRQLAAKAVALDLKALLEDGRRPGCPPGN